VSKPSLPYSFGREKGEKIPEMTLIDSGSAEINVRKVPGHREGDLIGLVQ
jgi:hypothetical protein